jgi:hypothetical protein
MSRVYSSLALALCVLWGCADRETKPQGLPSGPPPLPTLPSPVRGPGDGVEAEDESPASSQSATGRPERAAAMRAQKASKPQLSQDKPKGAGRQPSAPAATPIRVAPPIEAASAPTATPVKPASRVTVPSTAHVHPELPSGLQRDLDADARMQSWLDRALAIIDGCHSQNRAAIGTIEVVLTMHENERPDADIRALPPALSAVVACSTGALMRTKMPLFTGTEGTRYTTRIRFD